MGEKGKEKGRKEIGKKMRGEIMVISMATCQPNTVHMIVQDHQISATHLCIEVFQVGVVEYLVRVGHHLGDGIHFIHRTLLCCAIQPASTHETLFEGIFNL